MLNCPKCKTAMKSALSKKFDVIIEQCQSCKGFWLDEGEIFKFAPSRKKLERYYFDGLQQKRSTTLECPHCKTHMQHGIIPTLNYEIEQCDSCQGVFLDHGELFGVINGKTTPLKEKNASEYRVKKLPAFFRQALDADENVLWTQKPNSLSYFFSSIGIAISGIIFFILIAYKENKLNAENLFSIAPFFALFIALIFLVVYLKYKNTYYALTDKRSIISTGILGIDMTSIDHQKVTDLFLNVNVLDKILGSGTIKIQTAGAIVHLNQIKGFHGIDDPYRVYKLIKKLTQEAIKDR